MGQTLTLDLPDEVVQALKKEATRTGKTPEQVAKEWIAQLAQQPRYGSAEALEPFFGAWIMTPEERARIERMIDEERHREEGKG